MTAKTRSFRFDLSQQHPAILFVIDCVQADNLQTHSTLSVVQFDFGSKLENEGQVVAQQNTILKFTRLVLEQIVELFEIGVLAEQLQAFLVECPHPGMLRVVTDTERQKDAIVEFVGYLSTFFASVGAVLVVAQHFAALLATFVEYRFSCGQLTVLGL